MESCSRGASVAVSAGSGEHDGVDGAVQVAVTSFVEAVADGLAAADRNRAGAAEGGERGFVAAPAGVGEADDGLGGR